MSQCYCSRSPLTPSLVVCLCAGLQYLVPHSFYRIAKVNEKEPRKMYERLKQKRFSSDYTILQCDSLHKVIAIFVNVTVTLLHSIHSRIKMNWYQTNSKRKPKVHSLAFEAEKDLMSTFSLPLVSFSIFFHIL